MSIEEFKGAASLGGVIAERIAKQTEKPSVFDFGIIQSDGSLKTNNFNVAIPASQYLVLHAALSGDYRIRRGQRVVVCWIGNDAVILGRAEKGTRIGW